MWDNRRIANHSLITKYKWRTSDMRFAFAFLETMTERDGTNLIAIMRGAIMHDDALAAEWAHDSLPSLDWQLSHVPSPTNLARTHIPSTPTVRGGPHHARRRRPTQTHVVLAGTPQPTTNST